MKVLATAYIDSRLLERNIRRLFYDKVAGAQPPIHHFSCYPNVVLCADLKIENKSLKYCIDLFFAPIASMFSMCVLMRKCLLHHCDQYRHQDFGVWLYVSHFVS